jgi:sugar lactone lactonase YvrE
LDPPVSLGQDVAMGTEARPPLLVFALALSAAACAQLFGIDDIPYASPDAGVTPDAGPPGVGAPSGVTASAVKVFSVATLAGSGNPSFADGTGAVASFNAPQGVATDPAGNVYVGDTGNDRVRKITSGVVTTLAGSGGAGFADGTGGGAQFLGPQGVATDASGTVYVADEFNDRIRKITSVGVVMTLAGNSSSGFTDALGPSARFFYPFGVALDGAGNVYVADSQNCRIRKVAPAGGVTTAAGSGVCGFADGAATVARFSYPTGVAVDAPGNVYVADMQNHRIRKVSPAGDVTTLAGGADGYADGVGAGALFSHPASVAVDGAGNVYVADSSNHRIRQVTLLGVVTTIAGSGVAGFGDGPGALARFNDPIGIALGSAGEIYLADSANNRVRILTWTGKGELAVNWVAPNIAEITGYAASASADGYATRECATVASTACTIIGLASGVAYRVSVTANSSAGASAPSAPISAIPN